MIKSDLDTIAAIGTRAGESAIGIVRLSGNDAIKIATKIFKSNTGKKIKDLKTYSMVYGHIADSKRNEIDEVILSIMKKPRSYTREDIIEINCHGGLVATEKILDLCLANGARIAEPGEFTKRAFLNGRIDLSQAEAVIEIINAKTEESLKIAANNIKGGVKEKIERLRKSILEVLIELEASIDFIEEDLEITPYKELAEIIRNVDNEINVLIQDEKKGEILKNGIKVSIIGKTNVGKSSLLNILSKKEKAIVTHIAGTTRDAVEEILYLNGIPVILIDTAGIRKSKNIIEKIGVAKSIYHMESSELIILVLDCSKPLEKEDYEIINKLNGKKVIICLNKIDLEPKIKINDIKKIIDNSKILDTKNIKIVEISATKNIGIQGLEDYLKEVILGNENLNIENKIIINSRHKAILQKTKLIIKESLKAMEEGMSEEFPSSDLQIAYNMLGEIIGETTDEDILNGIFNKFCVGK